MIVTLTLNPAIDKTINVERLVPEKKMRCAEMQVDAGGGGINVSKAIHELGGKSTAVFTCGGLNGGFLTQLLLEKGIAVQAVEIESDTRESFVVNEQCSNKQYRFIMPGPSLCDADLQRLEQTLERIRNIGFLVCSGSLPPGVSPDYFRRLSQLTKERDIKLIVDTSGPSLKTVLESGVYLVKPNLTELCSLAEKDYLEPEEISTAAQAVMKAGNCEALVVSMGSSGAMLVTKSETATIAAPTVKKQSTVGAGDSMVAGIAWMLERAQSLQEAVRFGVACGTAATINNGTQLFTKEDALRFYACMQAQPTCVPQRFSKAFCADIPHANTLQQSRGKTVID